MCPSPVPECEGPGAPRKKRAEDQRVSKLAEPKQISCPRPSPVPKCEGPGAPATAIAGAGLETRTTAGLETGAT